MRSILQLKITSSTGFLKGMRYMVQEYLMGGLTSTMTVTEWMNGFETDFYDTVMEGDFYIGNDKDLETFVAPFINLNVTQIGDAELRIDTGS